MSYSVLKYSEHADHPIPSEFTEGLGGIHSWNFPKRKGEDHACFVITETESGYQLKTSYFIGVDWIIEDKKALYISPKLNQDTQVKDQLQIDFINMLFSAMRHEDVANQLDELYHIKWDAKAIDIEQKNDLLTPLLVMEFLSVLRQIVKKGLKKSYYPVESNLNGRIKGKVQISKTIKKNIVRNKVLYTHCHYEEFGLNNKENKLLKKALSYVKRYLPLYSDISNHPTLKNTFNYVSPAFESVSDEIELTEVKQFKTNTFYKEYDSALRLAKLILKRFGYNLSNVSHQKISTPPFWIDMSKLFELYVLGMLKDVYHNDVKYHFKTFGNELDYLINSLDYQMVIDAKYKPQWKYSVDHENVRQVSGYARLSRTYKELQKTYPESIDCLIIYPDQQNGLESLLNESLKSQSVEQYQGVWKIGVKLPVIKI